MGGPRRSRTRRWRAGCVHLLWHPWRSPVPILCRPATSARRPGWPASRWERSRLLRWPSTTTAISHMTAASDAGRSRGLWGLGLAVHVRPQRAGCICAPGADGSAIVARAARAAGADPGSAATATRLRASAPGLAYNAILCAPSSWNSAMPHCSRRCRYGRLADQRLPARLARQATTPKPAQHPRSAAARSVQPRCPSRP